jgi:hypothetical protein
MNNAEFVKIFHPRHSTGELRVIIEREEKSRDTTSILTNCKRFVCGLNLAYSITFPLGIHSVIIWKRFGSSDTEIPNRGRMFGWDKYFQQPARAVSATYAYELLTEKIRGGYDVIGLADFREESQSPLPEFAMKTRWLR